MPCGSRLGAGSGALTRIVVLLNWATILPFFLLACAESLEALVPEALTDSPYYTLLAAALLLPALQLRTLHQVSWLSLASTVGQHRLQAEKVHGTRWPSLRADPALRACLVAGRSLSSVLSPSSSLPCSLTLQPRPQQRPPHSRPYMKPSTISPWRRPAAIQTPLLSRPAGGAPAPIIPMCGCRMAVDG